MSRKQASLAALKVAFPRTLPVLTGFAFLGAAYGVLMSIQGYGALWSLLMSACAFCGSMQFVALTLLSAAFDPLQAFLLSLMVNARHIFYGIAMLDKYRGMGKVKPLLVFWLCDETFSIVGTATPPAGVSAKWYYAWVSLLDYAYWVLGAFVGGLLGGLVQFNTTGLDFVLTALFVVIFVEQWEKRANRLPAAIGVACSIASLLLFGKDGFLLPAMAAMLVSLTACRRKLDVQGRPTL